MTCQADRGDCPSSAVSISWLRVGQAAVTASPADVTGPRSGAGAGLRVSAPPGSVVQCPSRHGAVFIRRAGLPRRHSSSLRCPATGPQRRVCGCRSEPAVLCRLPLTCLSVSASGTTSGSAGDAGHCRPALGGQQPVGDAARVARRPNRRTATIAASIRCRCVSERVSERVTLCQCWCVSERREEWTMWWFKGLHVCWPSV